MDYYCHESVNIGKKNRLEIAFIEGRDRILANTESHARVIPEEEKVKEEEVVVQVPSKKEEEDEPVNGYTQISIFDDDDED